MHIIPLNSQFSVLNYPLSSQLSSHLLKIINHLADVSEDSVKTS